MVYRVENDDKYFLKNIDALERDKSESVDMPSSIDISLYRCNVRTEKGENQKNYTGYWIAGQNNEVLGYFVFKEHGVINEEREILLYGQAVMHTWLHKSLRRSGISPLVFNIHSPSMPIISDPYYGMSEKAYHSWINMRGFNERFFSTQKLIYAVQDELTDKQKFSSSAEGKEWLLVLENDNSFQ